jgi:hypothetical protein
MLLLLALACRCPSFASIEIVDNTGEVPQDTIEAIRAEVDLFAAQTGLPGICVDRIVLDETILHHAGELSGRYNPFGNRIRLQAEDPFFALRHELCHGWDYVLGWPSMDQGDLFEDYAPDSDLYPSKGQQEREAFAMACELGIPDLSVELAFAETCGTEAPDTSVRDYLRDEVYPYDETPPREVEFLDMLGEPWGLEEALDGWWIREVVGTEQALVVLLVTWPGHHHASQLRVVQLDPLRRALLSITDLPLRDYVDLTLAGGEDAAELVVHHADRPAQVFRLPPEGGLQRRAIPDLVVLQSDEAFAVGEDLWLVGAETLSQGWAGAIRLDRGDGTVDLDPFGNAASEWGPYAQQLRTVDGPLIGHLGPDREQRMADPRTGEITEFERWPFFIRAMDEEGFIYSRWAEPGPIHSVHRLDNRERFDLEACGWERTREDWQVYAQGQLWSSRATTGSSATRRGCGRCSPPAEALRR